MLNKGKKLVVGLAAVTLLVSGMLWSPPAQAAREGMIGEIVMFGGNFAPRTWAFCNGQLLSIAQNSALFSILGTNYGGDGRTSFGLPDLRGRAAVGAGQGPGLSDYRLGAKGGAEKVTLDQTQMPSHEHPASANVSVWGTNARGDSEYPGSVDANGDPVGHAWASRSRDKDYSSTAVPNVAMKAGSVKVDVMTFPRGGNQAHENMSPYQAVNFIIAIQGVFPSRN